MAEFGNIRNGIIRWRICVHVGGVSLGLCKTLQIDELRGVLRCVVPRGTEYEGIFACEYRLFVLYYS